jgi:hypothetical protein
MILLISASLLARITGMNHCARLRCYFTYPFWRKQDMVASPVTYIVSLFSPVQPVLPLGKFLTPMPKPVFDGKLKEERKMKFQNRTSYFIRERHFH